MFYNCKSLKTFSEVSQENIKIENEFKERKINNIDNINTDNSDELNNSLFNNGHNKKRNRTFINKNKINENKLKNSNKIHIIYIYSNINNKDHNKEWEKVNQILINSKNFLSQSLSFDSFQIKNNNQYSLNSEKSFSFDESKISTKINDTDGNKIIREYYYFLTSKINAIIPTDLSYLFSGCSSLISIYGLEKLNTSNVINMSYIFEECSL